MCCKTDKLHIPPSASGCCCAPVDVSLCLLFPKLSGSGGSCGLRTSKKRLRHEERQSSKQDCQCPVNQWISKEERRQHHFSKAAEQTQGKKLQETSGTAEAKLASGVHTLCCSSENCGESKTNPRSNKQLAKTVIAI
ncbi:uncharacterized protein LJ206_012883 isoform 1-T2 [Theristicus caerulescens]